MSIILGFIAVLCLVGALAVLADGSYRNSSTRRTVGLALIAAAIVTGGAAVGAVGYAISDHNATKKLVSKQEQQPRPQFPPQDNSQHFSNTSGGVQYNNTGSGSMTFTLAPKPTAQQPSPAMYDSVADGFFAGRNMHDPVKYITSGTTYEAIDHKYGCTRTTIISVVYKGGKLVVKPFRVPNGYTRSNGRGGSIFCGE